MLTIQLVQLSCQGTGRHTAQSARPPGQPVVIKSHFAKETNAYSECIDVSGYQSACQGGFVFSVFNSQEVGVVGNRGQKESLL